MLVLVLVHPEFPLATNGVYGILPPRAVEYVSLALGVVSAAAAALAVASRASQRSLQALLAVVVFIPACAIVLGAQIVAWRLAHPVPMP